MRLRSVLRSKIHTGRATECNLHYEGSIAIDVEILDRAGLRKHDRVMVANFTTGARWETYIIEAPAGSKAIGLNGAGARYTQVGDVLTIFGFDLVTPEEEVRPRIVVLDERNEVVRASAG